MLFILCTIFVFLQCTFIEKYEYKCKLTLKLKLCRPKKWLMIKIKMFFTPSIKCLNNHVYQLKALFNNGFTLKKIRAACPYMLLVSSIRCKNEALKKIAPQKHH